MSFEDYVQHITRKYQLAVALAVIKNKPENLTTDQYIAQLQEKIKINSTEMYDPDINDFDLKDSDFNFEDDSGDSLLASGLNKSFDKEIPDGTNEIESVNITDGFNITQIDDAASMNLLEDYNIVLECARGNDTNAGEEFINKDSSNSNTSTDDILKTLREIDENMQVDNNHLSYSISPFKVCDNSQSIITSDIGNILDVNMAIFEDLPRINFDISNSANNTQNSVVDERIKANVLKNLNIDTKVKDVNDIAEEINNVKNNEASILCHNFNQCMTNTQRVREIEIALKEIRDESTTQKILLPQSYSAKDTNSTVNHIAGEINNVKNNEASIFCHNFNQCMTNTQRVREIDIALKEIRDESTTQKIPLPQSYFAKDANNTVNEIMRNPVTEKENINQNNNLDNLTEEVITEGNIELNPILDTQATELYTLQEFTENNTQISQSQCQNVEISKNLLFGSKVKDNASRINNNCNQNEDDRTETTPAQINIVYSQDNNKTQNPGILTGPIQYIIDQSGKKYAVIQTMTLTNPIQTANINNTMDVDDETCVDTEVCGKNIDTGTAKEETTPQFEHYDKNSEDEIQASGSQEVIPFKVIKELSKVKTFLNQRDGTVSTDGFSSDSGYKSDSRSSLKTAQPALVCENWLHQSAHSLYSYVVQCPLVAVTHDIVTEISQVLGTLIDRLHGEEKYPAFLEELLDKVDSLLRQLCEGDSSCDNDLLEKDEIIQRILLLNKSTQILKFTIDKITKILDELHKNLTATDNLYELTNIGEIENISYIFFILEILIQKYVKAKNNINLSLSQTALNSQEAKTFKKSSISEIWRKKWNPSCKELKNVGSQEKSCVLIKCADVLNKVIVECMDGYSLVSFRALQCFNLLQNQ